MKGLPNYSVVKRDGKFYLYDAGRGVFLREPQVGFFGTIYYGNREFDSYEEAAKVAEYESYELAP